MKVEPGYGSCRPMESRDEPRAFPHDLENAGTTAAAVSHSSHSPCQRRQRIEALETEAGQLFR